MAPWVRFVGPDAEDRRPADIAHPQEVVLHPARRKTEPLSQQAKLPETEDKALSFPNRRVRRTKKGQTGSVRNRSQERV